MDYKLLSDGDILYSNGSRIGILSGDKNTVVCKIKYANSITVTE